MQRHNNNISSFTGSFKNESRKLRKTQINKCTLRVFKIFKFIPVRHKQTILNVNKTKMISLFQMCTGFSDSQFASYIRRKKTIPTCCQMRILSWPHHASVHHSTASLVHRQWKDLFPPSGRRWRKQSWPQSRPRWNYGGEKWATSFRSGRQKFRRRSFNTGDGDWKNDLALKFLVSKSNFFSFCLSFFSLTTFYR